MSVVPEECPSHNIAKILKKENRIIKNLKKEKKKIVLRDEGGRVRISEV